MRATRCKNRSAFSLAEAMIATVVLAIVAAGVLLPFTSGAAAQAEGLRRTLGAKLAGELMEKIVSTPFDEIVTTYDGYAEAQGQ
ncbi:MAG: type IV pilus modification PilV family protein, partial [Planctomycetota bacterium]